MDHSTAVNDKGEVAIFIDPTTAKPDGYRMDERYMTVMAGKSEIGSYYIDDLAFEMISSRPERDVLVVELDAKNEEKRSTLVPLIVPPTPSEQRK